MSDRDEKESEAEASAEPAPRRRRARVRDDAPLEKAETDALVDAPADAPEAKPAPKRKVDYAFLLVSSAVFLAADLGTKWWAENNLKDRTVEVVPGHFRFKLAYNPGGAFSIGGDWPMVPRLLFFFAVSVVAAIFIVSLYRKLEPHQKALKWALPLVLGGAFGNLVDRIRYSKVVDFLHSDIWPTFNVADVWIVAGVLLMGIDMFIPRSREERIAEAREKRKKAEAETAERRAEEAEEPGT